MLNNVDVLLGFIGKESIIFGNIEDIYSFYNKYVLGMVFLFILFYYVFFLVCVKEM